MEFMNRGAQPSPTRVTPGTNAGGTVPSHNGVGGTKSGKGSLPWKNSPTWLRVVWMVLLFSVTVLIIAIAALLYFSGPKEQDFVAKDRKQAVFLANGQVYFGEIKAVNKQYIDLQDIYYLNVNQQVQPDQKTQQQNQQQQISLVKLGCELHGPIDQMIINREQVTFWENLKTDGQVAEAIKKWVEQNPEGQKCAAPAANNTSNTTPATNTNTNNANTNNNTNKP
ncbi:MAG TPA: hypothetical protein VJ836_02320 [Candidatus Saccharimonadales bacterium]|nr:hypothetical protein [Candidatus Saccharimonadales bacterium]